MAYPGTQTNIDPALRPNNPLSSPPKPPQNGSRPHPSFSPLQPSPVQQQPPRPPATPGYYESNQSTQQMQDSPGEESPSANPDDPNGLKRPRACEACRQLKVKCEPDDNSPTGSCKRCAKANRQCVVTAPSRKRQKKTDSRVAELEKKIDALTASLAARGGDQDGIDHATIHHSGGHPPHPPHPSQHQIPAPVYPGQWSGGAPPPPATIRHQSPQLQQHGIKRKISDRVEYFGGELPKPTPSTGYQPPMPQPPPFPNTYASPVPKIKTEDEDAVFDPIEHGKMDANTVRRCWDRYIHEMCDHLPVVVFPAGTRWEDVRKTKPVLFLAVIAVSCGTIRPSVQGSFLTEATKILADRVVYRGEKSLELVQTIQCMTTFYQPPEKYEELNFNQLIHIAAVMALDIGLGKRFKKGNVALWRSYTEQKRALPDPSSAETRRCWLGCYFMCSNSAMSLRRPLLIRWSPYADECIEILMNAPDAAPTDKWLCQIVRGQRIAEMIGIEFNMDDPASQLSLTDHKTQYHLKAFERNLAQWHDDASPEMHKKPVLKHMFGVINLYMHEIAMHHNHNIDDFKPPFHATPIEGPPDPDFVTPAHIESLTTCMNSVHTVFDAFLSMDVHMLRALPTLFFVRNSYAAVALIKMYTAVSAKGSKFGSIIKTEDLKVDYYLERMIAKLSETAQDSMCKVALKFSMIFKMLKSWHMRRTDPDYRENPTSGRASQPASRGRTPLGHPQFASAKQVNDMRQNTSANANNNLIPVPPHQDPNTLPWAAQQQQRNGLQMLSDAAMAPPVPGQQLPPPQQTPPNWATQQQQLPPINPEMDPSLMYATGPGMTADGMVGMEPLDLMAYGFGDEFMAMGFGMGIEQGGWAF